MASIKISGLPEQTTVADDDYLVFGKNVAMKIPLSALRAALRAPNWARRITFNDGDAMSEDGYVYIGCRASVNRFIQISVNGVTAARACAIASSNTNGLTFTGLVPVTKGDVVTCLFDATEAGGTGYATACYFIPLKG